jgi:hypothetical protein
LEFTDLINNLRQKIHQSEKSEKLQEREGIKERLRELISKSIYKRIQKV